MVDEIEPKSPLASRRIWGCTVLALEIADLATGDPLSLNGAVKLALWSCGSGLLIWGWLARQRKLVWGAPLFPEDQEPGIVAAIWQLLINRGNIL